MKAFAHDARPQAARRPKLRNLFQQIIVGIEKERDPRREVVDFKAGLDRSFHVSDSIGDGECHFLDRISPRFPNVITADRNSVPVRDLARAEREGVGNQAQRRSGRKNVCAARDVLFKDIVLDCATDFFKGNALSSSHGEVKTEQDGGRG